MGNKCLNPFVKIRIFPGGPWGGWVPLDSYDWVVGNDPCWNCPWIFDQTRPWGAKRTVAAWGFSVFFTRDDHVGMTPIDSTKQYQQPLHFDIPSFSTMKSAICFHFERICSMEMARSNDYLMLWDAFGLWLGSAIMIWPSSNLRSEYSSFKARSCYLRCLCLLNCQSTIKVKTSGASCLVIWEVLGTSDWKNLWGSEDTKAPTFIMKLVNLQQPIWSFSTSRNEQPTLWFGQSFSWLALV